MDKTENVRFLMYWFLIQVKPNAHFKASENLRRQGFKVFLPLVVKTSKRNSKFINQTIPLFPFYIFIGSQSKQISWTSVNATRGVSKAVTLDGKYRAVNSEIVEGLKRRCDAKGIIKKIDNIVSGDKVRIEKGPFADFICQVDKIVDTQRAWVLIEILRQRTRAQVLLCNLSKVS